MNDKNKEAGNKTTRADEVMKLAKELDDWAQKLPPKQQTLLRLLLSREYRTIKNRIDIDERIEIGAGTYVFKKNIEQAVIDALRSIDGSGNPTPSVPLNPEDNWPRGGSVWPRADSWARSYWPRS